MEKAYKGMMGGYSVWKDGDEKHEPTHKIMTNEEYDDLQKKIRTLKNNLEKEKAAHENDVAEEKRKAVADHNNIVNQANEAIKKANEKVAKAEKERDDAFSLNVNLKRICKENANAKRGLKPKKQHSGFVVVRTQEARDRIPVKKGYQDLRVYKTTVETPYSVHLAISDVEPSAWEDGLKKLFGSAWQNHDANDLASAINEENSGKNFIYRQDWQTGKNDLWEIVCWHTKPITMAKEEYIKTISEEFNAVS